MLEADSIRGGVYCSISRHSFPKYLDLNFDSVDYPDLTSSLYKMTARFMSSSQHSINFMT